jgi:hypothetical protein
LRMKGGMLPSNHRRWCTELMKLYLATGLDLTTSPISDIYLSQIELDSDPPGLEIIRKGVGCTPEAVLRTNSQEFRFALN